jgi:hypothetical protein
MLGRYALLGTVGDVEIIGTPVGQMPVTELSGLFYSQIAPLEYYPDMPPGAVKVAVVEAQTLEINGQRIALGRAYSGEVHTLFSWNVLMALRDISGISRAHGYALGMMQYDRANPVREDAWHLGANAVMRLVNGAAGADEPLITTTGATKGVRYHVSPRLHLIDKRPTDRRSAEYFTQVLGSRLLALETRQHITSPSDARRQHLTITTNRQIERGSRAWTLDQDELHLINLLRLADGQPLLAPEILASGFRARLPKGQDRAEGIAVTAASLSNTIFNDGRGRGAIMVDDTQPLLIRLARSLVIRDARHMRTPLDPTGSDAALRTPLQEVLDQYRLAQSERVAAYQYPEQQKTARSPSDAHIALGRQHAASAFLRGDIGLRDIYMISFRLGIWFPFLEGSVLPLADGRRIAYDDFAAQVRGQGTMSLLHVGKALGISPGYYQRTFSYTMRKLAAAVESN